MTTYTQQELIHYGVKGMRWGVRKKSYAPIVKSKVSKVKDSRKEQKQTLKSIANSKDAHSHDKKVAKFASQSTTKKVATIVAKNIAEQVISDAFTGQTSSYSTRNKNDWMSFGKKIAEKSAKELALNEAMATSVASKYDSNGKLKNGKTNKSAIMTREELVLQTYSIAKSTAPFAGRIAGMKYSQMKAERQRNEAKFKSWGGRIIEAPVYDNIVDLNSHEYRVK